MRPQRPASAAEVTEVEAQEPEALTALKVHRAALFIIDFNLQLAELLAKSFVHCRNQPVMSLVGVDQDHQIVCEPRIFDVGVPAISRDLPRSLQHPVYFIEVEVAEQGRDDTPNAKGNMGTQAMIGRAWCPRPCLHRPDHGGSGSSGGW